MDLFPSFVWGLCGQEQGGGVRQTKTELAATCRGFKSLFEEWNSTQGMSFYLWTFLRLNISKDDGIIWVSTVDNRKCLFWTLSDRNYHNKADKAHLWEQISQTLHVAGDALPSWKLVVLCGPPLC